MGGVRQANDAFDLARSLTILSAITGNLDVRGGNLNCVPPTKKRSCYGSDIHYWELGVGMDGMPGLIMGHEFQPQSIRLH